MNKIAEQELQWDGKTLGRKTGHQGFFLLLKLFGRRLPGLILWPVTLYFFLFVPKTHKGTKQYFSLRFPGKNRLLLCVLSFKRIWILSNILLDKAYLRIKGSSSFRMSFPHTQRIKNALSPGKGLIILSAHTGAWEIAGRFFSRLGNKVWVVMHDTERAEIADLYKTDASKGTFNIIYSHDILSSTLQIYNALKAGDIVVMQGDRVMSTGVKASFLGRKATFPVMPYKIAAKTGSPITAAFCFRTGFMSYEITVENHHCIVSDTEEAISQGMRFYLTALEKRLQDYPLQWYNFFDFWEIE